MLSDEGLKHAAAEMAAAAKSMRQTYDWLEQTLTFNREALGRFVQQFENAVERLVDDDDDEAEGGG